MKPRVLKIPGSADIALLGINNYDRFCELTGRAGWFVAKYSRHMLKYKGTLLYQNDIVIVPEHLIYRLYDVKQYINWNSNEDVLERAKAKHDAIDRVMNNDKDFIMQIINEFGITEFKRPLMDHQLKTLAMYILLNGKAGNFSQMRTGKTASAVIYSWALISKGLVDCALVVVPNSIKYLWKDEILRDVPDYVAVYIGVVDGDKKKKISVYEADLKFYIVNYEAVRADFSIVKPLFDEKRYILILDECHRIKNWEAQQTRCIKQLKPKHLIGLSGTPVANKPHDVYEPINLVSPRLLGLNFEHYKRAWTVVDNYGNIMRYRNGALEEIHNRTKLISTRVLRAEVNLEIGKVIQPHILYPSKKFMELYNNVKESLLVELMSHDTTDRLFITSFLARLVRLQQVTDGYLPKVDENKNVVGYTWLQDIGIEDTKLTYLMGWLNDYLDDVNKVVIFSRFVPVLERLLALLKDYGAVLIYGKTPHNQVLELQNRFKTADNCKIMLCNTMCAEGKDFNPCNFVFFYDRVWGLKDNTQAEDRVTGVHQKKESTIMPLMLKDTIDEHLEKTVLPNKKRDAIMVEDGYTIDDLYALLGRKK